MGLLMVMHSLTELQCAKYIGDNTIIPIIFGALEFILTVHDHVEPHLEGCRKSNLLASQDHQH